MTGQQISKAWKEWLESPGGRKCADGSASGKYLTNRLEYAFQAGIAAAIAEASGRGRETGSHEQAR